MCGLAGYLAQERDDEPIRAMCDALRHRGPDDAGIWSDPAAGIVLGHRRLSILDLSPAGHQPMASADGRFVVVFNGEIYNHLSLRTELAAAGCAPAWGGHSDTETLLAGIVAWGLPGTLRRSVGMFALAVWDRARRTLMLARDRIGEKPLYYGWQGSTFLFGSELKALTRHPDFSGEIDRDALALFMRHGYVPAPWSIYRGIRKLRPGTVLSLPPGVRELNEEPYWSAMEAVEAGLRSPFVGTPAEALTQLEGLLETAVRGQMLADVPLGAFLSGGVDSSLIVALMQAASARPVQTFTIGFRETAYNEAGWASDIAKHLGTDHCELEVSPPEAQAVVPLLPRLYCEPFADSSQIPTYLVSQLARRRVTVALSGDAGDELFGGYDRYRIADSLWRRLSPIPGSARPALARLISAVPTGAWDRLLRPVRPMLPPGLASQEPGARMHRAARLLATRQRRALYRELVSLWREPATLVLGASEPDGGPSWTGESPAIAFIHEMMELDLVSYLPDDILVKVDRAAMGVSLETRVPFLDHRVVEFAWRLPLTLKIRDGQAKWPLRQLLYRHVPRQLIDRPKMGFGVPISEWLRGPLRDWADDLLDERRLRREGYLNPEPIRAKWEDHVQGRQQWHYQLWTVLMFQSWLADRK